jgi:signal transduction histidine kinase
MDERRFISQVEKILIEPFVAFRSSDSTRTARLLASFLLVIIILMTSVRLAAMLTDPDYETDISVNIGTTILVIAYLSSRTRHYRIGAWLMIAPIPLITLVSIMGGNDPNPQTTLVYLIIALLLASIFFTRLGILILVLINLAIFLLLPVVAEEIFPTFSSIISPLAANLVAGTLILVFMTHRSRLEKDRQEELRKLNLDLTESESSLREFATKLETLVYERTIDLESLNEEYKSFAYSISHDLRAPIRAISGFSEIFLETPSTRLSEEEKEYLHRIHRAADRMENMIEGLLKLSRISRETLHIEEVNLSSLSQKVFNELIQGKQDRRVNFNVQEGARTMGDEILLRLVLQNLIDNAIKFSRDQDASEIDFSWFKDENENSIFCVRDNGIGFDENLAGKLFSPFQRLHLDLDFDGIGIGLATVHRIIHKHNGRIWVESEPGKGSSFFFSLNPLSDLEIFQF